MWKRILYYLNPLTLFEKKDKKDGFNLRMMHGINRISILLFLIGLLLLLYKSIS